MSSTIAIGHEFGRFDDSGSGALDIISAQEVDARIGHISVKDSRFGAKGDGTTDDTAAIQAAIDYVLAQGGGTVYFPAGDYHLPCTTSLDPGIGGIIFRGEGWDATRLMINEGTAGSKRYLFKNIVNTVKSGLVCEDLQIRGTLDTSSRRAGNPFWLDYYSDITFERVKWRHVAAEAMDIHYVRGRVTIRGCDFADIAADAARARDTDNVIVDGNVCIRVGDNWLAIHTNDTTLDTWLPQREGVVVTNNHVINAGHGLILGSKKITYAHNHSKITYGGGIIVGASLSFDEGKNPMYDISIHSNIITDVIGYPNAMAASTGAPIGISNLSTTGSSATNSTKPGYYDSTSGAIIMPWDWNQSDGSGTDAIPPMNGVSIKDNITGRTLPSVTNVSDWGYGEVVWQGVYYDPAITDTVMRVATGVINFVYPDIWNVTIAGNTLRHATRGINLPAPVTNLSYRNWKIYDNLIEDTTTYGLNIESAAFSADIDIFGNTFDVDPYRKASLSNLDGTYDSDGLPRAINSGDVGGLMVRENCFQNTNQVFSTNVASRCLVKDNILRHGTPSAQGFNVGNKGIGNIPFSSTSNYRSIIVDADRTSATYGAVSSVMAGDSTSMPSSGWYPSGWFVRNGGFNSADDPAGWQRITTGSNHDIYTDWMPIGGKLVQALTGAGTVSQNFDRTTLSNATGGTYAVTISAPAVANIGRHKQIEMIAGDATNTVTMALTNVVGAGGSTTATFSAAGATLLLQAVQTGASTYRWALVTNIGVTLS